MFLSLHRTIMISTAAGQASSSGSEYHQPEAFGLTDSLLGSVSLLLIARSNLRRVIRLAFDLR